MIENKIREYFKVNRHFTNKGIENTDNTMAKDIAEICENHVTNQLRYEAKLEKENAELKAKCNLCYDDKTEKSNNALIELNNKLVVRNGRILDLENELTEYELINKHHIELIGRLEEQLKAIKYLSRQGVEEIIWTLSDGLKFWYQNKAGTSGQNILYSENLVLEAIAAICKLTIIEVKTLDKAEVEKITDKHLGTLSDHSNLVTDILKLAIPSRDKIIEVLNIRLDPVGCPDKTKFIELIADEIMKEEK